RDWKKDARGVISRGLMRGSGSAAILLAFPGVTASADADEMHGKMFALASGMQAIDDVWWKVRRTSAVSFESEIWIDWVTPAEDRRRREREAEAE
ncbi:MAG: hypothetical protein ACOC0P_02835, partial [Planctomycetota bacterium]